MDQNRNNLPIYSKETSYKYSFKGDNNLKEIYNQWDLFINWSLNEGNSHYAFTINYPNEEKHKELYKCEVLKNILNLHPLSKWESFYWGGEKYSNFQNLDISYISEFSWIFDIHWVFYYEKINLISWIFTVVEENENGVAHIHGIIAIKNLIDYNKNISNSIVEVFKKKYIFIDIVFKNLNYFQDIKGWIRYLHQNKQWIFKPLFNVLSKDIKYIWKLFIQCYIKNYNIHNSEKEKDCLNFNENIYHSLCLEISSEYGCNSNYEDFIGIKLNKNELDENILIDLISNYMYLNKLYINNENVFKKIEGTSISYKKIGTISDLFFDNFQNTIIPFYSNNFPIQFDNFDFYFLIKNFKLKMENNILKIKSISNNKINFNFNVMEFNDGVYDLQNNLFIKKNELFKIGNKVSTIKYYNKSYSNIRQTKPINWINGIKNALGKNNHTDFIVLCLFIANLFQPIDENSKKNFLYIHGPSNTGKTTYSSKILIRYFGVENVGSIINDSNFKFQDIEKKLFIILEEFKYKKNSASDFLKLLGGEPLLTSKKYSKEHIKIENLKGLIVSNNVIDEKNEEIKKALLNRLFVLNFLHKNLNPNDNINKSLAEEEANIIVFCNKLYFNHFNKEQKRLKLTLKKYNNKSLIDNNKFEMSLAKFVFKGVLNKINLNEIVNENTNDSIIKFKNKFSIHTNSYFEKYDYNMFTYKQTDNIIALTNTRHPDPVNNGWKIGQLIDNKTQFVNKNNIAWFNKETFELLKENQKNTLKDNIILENIKDVINNNKDKINNIESDLSLLFEKTKPNLKDKLYECLQAKTLNGNCLEYYTLKYGDGIITMAEQIINNKK